MSDLERNKELARASFEMTAIKDYSRDHRFGPKID